MFKKLPLFSNLRSPSGALLLTRAKPLVAFRISDTRAILLRSLTNSLASTKCIFESHTRDFHRKESDSFIEARMRFRNDVTVLSPSREGKKGKVDYYFMKIHSCVASACRIIIAMIVGRNCTALQVFMMCRERISSRLPSSFFSFHRRDIRNSLKRIQMTSPLCIFMLPVEARSY